MSDGPGGSDQALWDRLQALRAGTNYSPSIPAKQTDTPTRISVPLNEKPSRQDALSDRLRHLRIQAEQANLNRPRGTLSQPPIDTAPTAISHSLSVREPQPPPQSHSRPVTAGTPQPAPQSAPAISEGDLISFGPSTPLLPSATDGHDEVDTFLQTDDETLEQLLEGLALDNDAEPELPEWASQPPLSPPPKPKELTPAERVAALLEEISKLAPASSAAPVKAEQDDKGDSDDSDGEGMKDEVNQVLEQAADELAAEEEARERQANLSPPNISSKPKGEVPEAPDLTMPMELTTDEAEDNTAPAADSEPLPTELESRMAALLSSSDAPTNAEPGEKTEDEKFNDDFTARLTALHTKPITSSSNLSLPEVPSDAPGALGWRRTKYTDDSMKDWCTVCLEDATLRCLGCDGDVYCMRCWKAMHISPQAGFEERSHKAEILERKKRKPMLAA